MTTEQLITRATNPKVGDKFTLCGNVATVTRVTDCIVHHTVKFGKEEYFFQNCFDTYVSLVRSSLHAGAIFKPASNRKKTGVLQTGLEELVATCHGAAKKAGWWNNLDTGEPLALTQELVGDKLMLIVTEIAEAKEGHRKNLNDDHIKHRPMIEVELADAIIRIAELAGMMGLDLAGAVIDKLAYNANRPDHKIENRKAVNGKKT